MNRDQIKADVFEKLGLRGLSEFRLERPSLASTGDLRKKETWEKILRLVEVEVATSSRLNLDPADYDLSVAYFELRAAMERTDTALASFKSLPKTCA